MNKTLLAVSAGLIMGAVLFGMVQRDQDVDASPDISHPDSLQGSAGPRTLGNLAPSHIRHPGQADGSPRWPTQQPRYPTSSSAPIASSPFDDIPPAIEPQGVTTVAQEWQQRRAMRQQELAERRKQLLAQQGGRQQLSTEIVNAAAQTSNQGVADAMDARRDALENRIAQQRGLESTEVAKAREAFEDQLADGVGGREIGGEGERSGPRGALASSNQNSQASGPTAPLPGSSAADAFGGFDFTRLIEGGGFLNGEFVTFGSGGGGVPSIPTIPEIPGLPPIPGFPGSPSGDPLELRAEWFPVSDGACVGPEYSRTNDLYIRVNKPFRVINVTSATATGLRVVGGEFLHNSLGGNVTPADLTSCSALDTFLAYGPSVPTVAGSNPFADTSDGQVVSTSWFGFTDPSTPGVVPPTTKPGDKRRLWVGRFVVSGNPQSVSGSLSVALVDPDSLIPIPQFITVDVPHDPLLWAVDGDPPPPALNLFDIAQTNVIAGKPIIIRVGVEDPAPAGGVRVDLTASVAGVIPLPSSITIGEGLTERTLSVRVLDVATRTDVVLTATSNGVSLTDAISIDPRAPGDYDSNGLIDGTDLAGLLAAWNTDNPFADFNGDGIVDGADLAQVLASWSATAPPPPLPPDDGPVIAKWIPVAITGSCATTLDGVRSADLYLGFEEALAAPAATIVQSSATSGLRIEGGVFHQDPNVNRNTAPDVFTLLTFPCALYDSYITLGETQPFFLPPGTTPDVEWGTTLVAEWLTNDFSGNSIQFEMNPTKFGDSRRYIRIARISATEGATYVGGRLLVRYAPISTSGIVSEVVTVPHNPAVWGQLDLNADGLLDSLDVDLVIAAMGSDSADADFDASGSVDADDLRVLLSALSDPATTP